MCGLRALLPPRARQVRYLCRVGGVPGDKDWAVCGHSEPSNPSASSGHTFLRGIECSPFPAP